MGGTGRMLTVAALLGVCCAAVLSGSAAPMIAVAYAVCLTVVWFTGLRALGLWIRSWRRMRVHDSPARPGRIALLYCTADDLDVPALMASAAQDIPVEVYVLDDSSPAHRAEVDEAATRIGARVLRRAERTGAKAGNVNHALLLLPEGIDAVILLDSDTVLPAGFARRAWAALAADPRTACVQGVPVAGGETAFARFFGPLVRSHARINHATRARIGFPAFVGRGAMLSVRALRDVGGFPHAVSEDLALSLRMRERGWRIVHRPDLEFGEAFPVDYAAFRVQQAKAAEGATEFLRANGERMRVLRLRERIDLQVETGLLSIGAAAGLGALAAGAMLAFWGSPTPIAVTAVTGALAVAPLLPEAVRRAGRGRVLSGLAFLLVTPLLYSSVALLILRHAWAVASGRRAEFVVTPKRAVTTDLRGAVSAMRSEWAWAVCALVSAVSLGAVPLAVPFLVPALTGTLLLCGSARAARHRIARPVPHPPGAVPV